MGLAGMTDADGLIRLAVLERLAVESQWVDVSRLCVAVVDGIVSLRGELDDRADADALAWELVSLSGVSDVEVSGLQFRFEPDPQPNRHEGVRGTGGRP
jgi:osmotically-inducible protein OsmY